MEENKEESKKHSAGRTWQFGAGRSCFGGSCASFRRSRASGCVGSFGFADDRSRSNRKRKVPRALWAERGVDRRRAGSPGGQGQRVLDYQQPKCGRAFESSLGAWIGKRQPNS